MDLKVYFLTESHEQTKYKCSKKKTYEATYSGEKRNQKIEDYYNIIPKSFNDLEQAGGVYALPEYHNTNNF